jgi:RNA polymerase sigma factor (sigma-70 family)
MPISHLSGIRRYLRRLAGGHSLSEQSDGQLLASYVTRRDETAFAALVDRYGSLVLGVCERVLQDAHEAEEAFQATFLVLIRKADSLSGEKSLANWLYVVAHRTASKVRVRATRRRATEKRASEMPRTEVTESSEAVWDELRPLLDEELAKLPEKYRAPLVLCFLQGKTHQEAAAELGWPSGSMSRRMSRAQELLRSRLARRGVVVTSAMLLLLLSRKASAACVPAALTAATSKGAIVFQAELAGSGSSLSGASGALPARVVTLAEEIIASLSTARRKALISALLAWLFFGLASTGSLTVAYQTLVAGQPSRTGKNDCIGPASGRMIMPR